MTKRPWKPRPRLESRLHSQEIVRLMKFGCSGPTLSIAFPNEFGKVLNDYRSLNFDQLPNYGAIRRLFASLAERMGYPRRRTISGRQLNRLGHCRSLGSYQKV